LIVDAGEMLKIKVGVDLGRGDVGMAQEFLHAPQILTRLEQMGGERMPEQMRVHVHR
jgi:hypothetical protein